LEPPSDAFSYTSFRGSFSEPQLHLSFETAGVDVEEIEKALEEKLIEGAMGALLE